MHDPCGSLLRPLNPLHRFYTSVLHTHTISYIGVAYKAALSETDLTFSYVIRTTAPG